MIFFFLLLANRQLGAASNPSGSCPPKCPLLVCLAVTRRYQFETGPCSCIWVPKSFPAASVQAVGSGRVLGVVQEPGAVQGHAASASQHLASQSHGSQSCHVLGTVGAQASHSAFVVAQPLCTHLMPYKFLYCLSWSNCSCIVPVHNNSFSFVSPFQVRTCLCSAVFALVGFHC